MDWTEWRWVMTRLWWCAIGFGIALMVNRDEAKQLCDVLGEYLNNLPIK